MFIGKIKGQLGMSLTEMMIVMGLVGIAALGMSSMMGGVSDTVKDATVRSAKIEFASAMGVYLHSRLGCQDLKAGNLSFSAGKIGIQLKNWKYEGVEVIGTGTKMPKFNIESLMGHIDLSPNLAKIKMTYPNGSTKDLQKSMLIVSAVLKSKNFIYKHEYNVPVLLDLANKIEFCGDDQTIAETCTSLKGKFDPVTKECRFEQSCAIQGSFTTLSCNPKFAFGCDTSRGQMQVNPVTGNTGCPVGSTAVATGADTWTTQYNCGKKCTADINHTLGYYTCLKCP